jgi:hypothetical protein
MCHLFGCLLQQKRTVIVSELVSISKKQGEELWQIVQTYYNYVRLSKRFCWLQNYCISQLISTSWEKGLTNELKGSAVSIMTGRPGFDPRRRQRIFPLLSASRPALGPTQPPVQWVPGALSPGVNAAGACCWPPTPFQCRGWRKNRSYTSSTPLCQNWRATDVLCCTLPNELKDMSHCCSKSRNVDFAVNFHIKPCYCVCLEIPP